jgi:hypothetical protein
MGRYITQDPIGLRGGLNVYNYPTNPVSWIDPLGLSDNPFWDGEYKFNSNPECVCGNMTVKRNKVKWGEILKMQMGKNSTEPNLFGHHWMEIDGNESYGYWPNLPLTGLIETIKGVPGSVNRGEPEDPDHGSVGKEEFHPKIKGGAAKKDCDQKCAEKADCFRQFAKDFPIKTWSYPARTSTANCHSFQREGMRKCDLEK